MQQLADSVLTLNIPIHPWVLNHAQNIIILFTSWKSFFQGKTSSGPDVSGAKIIENKEL